MIRCLKRETLQAFIDHELPDETLKSAEFHLAACATCQAALETMHTDAAQLSRLLDSLLPENESQIMPASTIRFAARSSAKSSRFVIASIAGIAACALFAFVMFRPKTAPPVANNSTSNYSATSQLTQQIASVIPSSIENAKPLVAKASPHTQRVVHKSSIHSLGDSDLKFIPLDDDGPIESGMIVRMDLNATPSASHSARGGKKVTVDVLLDQQGEVRAIRFLDGGAQ